MLLFESMNLNQYNQSAAQPGLAVGVINNLSIPSSNREGENAIEVFTIEFENKLNKQIVRNKREIQLLKEHKQSLITNIVTGKVDVRNEIIS